MEPKNNFFSSNSQLFRYLEKKQQNRQAVQTFEIVATIFTISFFVLFAIYPAISTISNLITEIKTKESLSDKLLQKINQVVLAQDAFVKIQEKYSIVDSAFPDYPKFTHIASQFQNIGRQVGVDTEKLNFGIPNSNTNRDTVTDLKTSNIAVNVTDETDYATALDFINQIKSNRRLINIKAITLSKKEDNNENYDNNNIVSFTFSSEVLYWSKAP